MLRRVFDSTWHLGLLFIVSVAVFGCLKRGERCDYSAKDCELGTVCEDCANFITNEWDKPWVKYCVDEWDRYDDLDKYCGND